jgi:hypothetical protein
MFNMGMTELLIVAAVAVPGLLLTFGPIVLLIVLWQRHNDLRARVARLESERRFPAP